MTRRAHVPWLATSILLLGACAPSESTTSDPTIVDSGSAGDTATLDPSIEDPPDTDDEPDTEDTAAPDDTADPGDTGETVDGGPPDLSDLAPELLSFIGGEANDRIQSVFVAENGDMYIAGNTESESFPTTAGAWQTEQGGEAGLGYDSQDGYVGKLTPEGELVWLTRVGGSGREGLYGVRADAAGNVYVSGTTWSSDFPTTAGAFDETSTGGGVTDAFIVKLSPDGSEALYSTVLGGDESDFIRGGLTVDANGCVWAAGLVGSTDFPTTPNAVQPTFAGGTSDGFIIQLSADGSELLYSSFMGGSDADHAASGVALVDDGSVLVAGATASADFTTTTGAAQTALSGGSGGLFGGDGWVRRISADGTELLYSTYIGGSGDDWVTHNHGISVDDQGRAVVAGFTSSADFGGVSSSALQPTLPGTGGTFITRVSVDGSQLESTYLGGIDTQEPEINDVHVDAFGRILVTGSTEASDFPTTANAFQPDYSGGTGDGFIVVLDPSLSEALYSTYIGGTGTAVLGDRGRAIWGLPSGGFLVGGSTNSADLPVFKDSMQTVYGGDERDGWLAVMVP